MTRYKLLSDQDLVILLQQDNKEVYTEIYNRYWAVLFRHARKMLHDDEEAKDVVQDIFSILWTRRSEIKFTTSLSSYLYAAVRNKILNLIEHNKVKTNYLAALENFIDEGECITDDSIRENELSLLIEKEIDMLPKKMREVFQLSRKANLSYKKISEEMNISDKTVKKQVSNAIKILRLKLGGLSILFILHLIK